MSSGGRTAQTIGVRSRAWLVFILPLAAIGIWRVVLFAGRAPVAAPFQYDYEEGNILNAISRILHSATPYPDPHALPSILNPYGPAAYYLLAIPAKLFGVSFLYPRLLIVACAFVVATLIAMEIRRQSGSALLGAAFAFVFLAIPNVQQWMWLLRVDMLGLAFTAAGLVMFSNELQTPTKQPRTLVLALLFAIAALVKISLLAAPAACFAGLALHRRHPEAARLALQTLSMFAIVMGAFAIVTHGAVLTDVFCTHPDPFSFRVYTQGLTGMIVAAWPLVLLAILAIARDLAQRRYCPAVLWVMVATFTAITAGKLGSNTNHFVEWNAALCMAAAIGVLEIRKSFSTVAAPAVVLIVVAAVLAMQPSFAAEPLNRDCYQAYNSAREQAGDELSENVGALVLGGKKVWVSNPYVLAQLVEHSGWSDAALVEMVRQRRFAAIYSHYDYLGIPAYLAHGTERESPELLRAIADNYDASTGFACQDMGVVYRPKAPAAIQSKQVPGSQ